MDLCEADVSLAPPVLGSGHQVCLSMALPKRLGAATVSKEDIWLPCCCGKVLGKLRGTSGSEKAPCWARERPIRRDGGLYVSRYSRGKLGGWKAT